MAENRTRLKQLFQYVRALHDIRNQPPQQIGDGELIGWLEQLPDHPAIQLVRPSFGEFAGQADEDDNDLRPESARFTLSVGRPIIIDAPPPPGIIRNWIRPGWDNVDADARIFDVLPIQNQDGNMIDAAFDEDPARRPAFESWKQSRDEWAVSERPARSTLALYQRLYSIYSTLERDAAQMEIVVGDGILDWDTVIRQSGVQGTTGSRITYPLLLQRLELSFDPATPKFELTETDQPASWNGALLRLSEEIPETALSRTKQEFDKRQSQLHPLDDEATSAFLSTITHLLSDSGEFYSTPQPHDPTRLQIYRSPVIFQRRRGGEMAAAFEAVIEDIAERDSVAPALNAIVGLSPIDEAVSPIDVNSGDHSVEPPLEILFTKPSNKEQAQIAERLDRYGCVIVQGPPGTGKTHTIANLIGHLLAQGKRVLVTSHTSKSLRVLREKVALELQPLCVSVLDRDSESRAQLEDAVAEIVRRLSAGNVEDYDRQARSLSEERERVMAQLQQVRGEIAQRATDEYRPIVVGGESISPSEAARFIAAGAGNHDWIPSPVTPGDALPLPVHDVDTIYRANIAVSANDEHELSHWLPEVTDLIDPDDFRQMVTDRDRLKATDLSRFEVYWQRLPQGDDVDRLGAVGQALQRAKIDISSGTTLQRTVMTADLLGETNRAPWEHLVSSIEAAASSAAEADEACLRFKVSLPDEIPLRDQIGTLDDIVSHLEQGKPLRLLLHPTWKRFVAAARVDDRAPNMKSDFEALRAVAISRNARDELRQRWQHQIGVLAAEIPSVYLATPERYCRQYIQQINDGLSWQNDVWLPIRRELDGLGFDWVRAESTAPIFADDLIELKRIEATIDAVALPALGARQLNIRIAKIDRSLAKLNAFLNDRRAGDSNARIVNRLREAIETRDVEGFEASWKEVDRLNRLRPTLKSRNELLDGLRAAAPAWVASILDRTSTHEPPSAPRDALAAWKYRQYQDEILRREQSSRPGLESEALRLTQRLEELTSQLVESRSWAAQIRRTTPAQRQALVGWEQTVKRIGKGTGKKAPRLRRAARQLMSDCRTAVPVWIMPLAQLAESFNPNETMFDVVIVDEASQCDVKMLLAMYISKAAVVVGDDEQVTPDAVGLLADQELRLQSEYLDGIPNKDLYDGRLSIYDLALQSFGGVISLREHFRCVPEIIQFSNELSYQGRILPLRESGDLQPLVAYRVNVLPVTDNSPKERINRQEAEAVVALVQAIVEQPRYQGKTIGVVSLSGEPQANFIDRRLHETLPPTEVESRRIIAGIPPHFQGDERDIMLLSMVDLPADGPLAKREFGYHDLYKKRYNVAVSRARDQLWLVHSVDSQIDLKPGDLRKRLLDYVLNPKDWHIEDDGSNEVESEFERQVLKRLQQAGYHVVPQWKVGYYRIDLVVEGGGKRLAIECDGDRYHTIEKIPDDMERQQILERLGWTFERIRGSAFFRDPDSAMRQVFQRLERMGIYPESHSDASHGQMIYETEVRDSVIRRAEAILRESQVAGQPNEDTAPLAEQTLQADTIRPQKQLPTMTQPQPQPASVTPVPAPAARTTAALRKEARPSAGWPLSAAERRISPATHAKRSTRAKPQRAFDTAPPLAPSTSGVRIGSVVTVRSLGEETVYEIAESGDTHATPKKVAATSPVGKALLGHRVGDRVKVQSTLMVYDMVIVQLENP